MALSMPERWDDYRSFLHHVIEQTAVSWLTAVCRNLRRCSPRLHSADIQCHWAAQGKEIFIHTQCYSCSTMMDSTSLRHMGHSASVSAAVHPEHVHICPHGCCSTSAAASQHTTHSAMSSYPSAIATETSKVGFLPPFTGASEAVDVTKAAGSALAGSVPALTAA